jgi:hypothetical protein
MAKMYYSVEETLAKLTCNEDQLRGLVRAGKLREFRDAGKLNYKVEDVDGLVAAQAGLGGSSASGELSLEDSGEISLLPGDSGSAAGLKLDESGSAAGIKPDQSGSASGLKLDDSTTKPAGKTGPSGTDAPIDLSGSSGELKLEESGELRLSGTGSGELKLEDTRPPKPASPSKDAISLDEVDKDRLEGMKKDDTVITNIGISVFDDDDLEIAADPLAKTMLTSGGEDHLGLDGSAGGSGLLDLTRESDDTSLGAELLEGIDMGDTAETVAPTQASEAIAPSSSEEILPEPTMEPALSLGPRPVSVHYVEAASPAFTGLLVAAAIALVVLAATVVATSMGAWPTYLATMADYFWAGLGGMIGLGALAAGIGAAVGMKPSGPKAPKKPKEPKVKKEKPPKKAKKGEPATA